MSALLDRGEKSVARSVGIDSLVQEHALEAWQQEPDRTERMSHIGQELVGDADEDRRPALFRDAVGHRRESPAHQREDPAPWLPWYFNLSDLKVGTELGATTTPPHVQWSYTYDSMGRVQDEAQSMAVPGDKSPLELIPFR